MCHDLNYSSQLIYIDLMGRLQGRPVPSNDSMMANEGNRSAGVTTDLTALYTMQAKQVSL